MKQVAIKFAAPLVLSALAFIATAHPAQAALSFCNRTTVAIEAALGYRGETAKKADEWISEGWWRIEPGQCARVYSQPLTSRFYFYFAHAMAQVSKDKPPTVWSGKYTLCTNTKAFRVEGSENCTGRDFQTTGFQELDLGSIVRDYTLDFRDGTGQ